MLSSEQKKILIQIIDSCQFKGSDIEMVLEIKKELETESSDSNK